jgi:hypothetical protein
MLFRIKMLPEGKNYFNKLQEKYTDIRSPVFAQPSDDGLMIESCLVVCFFLKFFLIWAPDNTN